jgi:hypothetical protein
MSEDTVYIIDKKGIPYWKTHCSVGHADPEIRNMQRRLEWAAKNPKAFAFLDLQTAVIMVNGEPYQPNTATEEMGDEELLKALGF